MMCASLQKWNPPNKHIQLFFVQKVKLIYINSIYIITPPPKTQNKRIHPVKVPQNAPLEERLPSACTGAVLVAEMGPLQMPGRPVAPGAKRKDGCKESTFTSVNGDLPHEEHIHSTNILEKG